MIVSLYSYYIIYIVNCGQLVVYIQIFNLQASTGISEYRITFSNKLYKTMQNTIYE